MPLGEKTGWEKSQSRFCGVETEFHNNILQLLSFNLSTGGFDFVVAPLIDPSFRSSSAKCEMGQSQTVPFASSDLILGPSQWSCHVVGKISSWIDLDSEDETLKLDSEISLRQEISWASHLSLQACLLPPPKGALFANYARCVNQILQGLNNMQLWLRIPLEKTDENSVDTRPNNFFTFQDDSWEIWNSFRLLCEHHNQFCVALDVLTVLPPSHSLSRWFGEPVKAALISTDCFLSNTRGYPCLSKQHQKLLIGFFNHSVQIVVSGGGNPAHHISADVSESVANHFHLDAKSAQRHPLRPYLEYIGYLFQQMDPLSEQECFELGYRDFLQSPLQPLMDNLEAQTYETFEKDTVKYAQYERAICQALLDRGHDGACDANTVLMVVGAGRGPLVRASLQAAEKTETKLKIYAIEKNPNAVVTLHSLVKLEGWEDIVTVISSDMRHWDAPQKADILVSELLGSFGDNELSPECLGGAQKFLKKGGISIPSSYTSFIQPVSASKLHNDIKSHKDLAHFETAYVVKLHNVSRLSPSQPVFTFTHPDYLSKMNNQRYKKLQFEVDNDAGSAMVHGFAGYFDAELYKDVHLGIEPSMATPNMFSWFAMFFPLRTPVRMLPGVPLEVHFWRCCGPSKVWYEWCVTSPCVSPIHNSNGRSYWVGL